MCIVALLSGEGPEPHTHGCGHECECEMTGHEECIGCELGAIMVRRYASYEMTPQEGLGALYLSMRSIIKDKLTNAST